MKHLVRGGAFQESSRKYLLVAETTNREQPIGPHPFFQAAKPRPLPRNVLHEQLYAALQGKEAFLDLVVVTGQEQGLLLSLVSCSPCLIPLYRKPLVPAGTRDRGLALPFSSLP